MLEGSVVPGCTGSSQLTWQLSQPVCFQVGGGDGELHSDWPRLVAGLGEAPGTEDSEVLCCLLGCPWPSLGRHHPVWRDLLARVAPLGVA